MNIIDENDTSEEKTINVVGTPNATRDVYHHVKTGGKRAHFFRYFYFNLPKITKAIVVLAIAVIGISAGIVASSHHLPFLGADIALWIVVFFAVVFLLMALFTRKAIWDFGSFIALGACTIYIGGLLGHTAPYVWNGASLYLAATWNLMLFTSIFYFILNWAINVHIFVVWPDDQHFTD